MQDAAATRDRLVAEACVALGELGLAGLTVGAVAHRARVSTALIHYHFDTKRLLLLAAASRLAALRSRRRLEALTDQGGLDALDALWAALDAGAASGAERAYAELTLYASDDDDIAAVLAEHRTAERAGIAARLPGLLTTLGARPAAGIEELVLVLMAALDGFGRALLLRAEAAQVRAAYDAFWLTLIAAGQARR